MSDSLPNDVSLSMYAIDEPRNNDLRVVVMEARPGCEPVQTTVGLATPVRPDETCRAYEIMWSGYVAYNVRNESYFRPSPVKRWAVRPWP